MFLAGMQAFSQGFVIRDVLVSSPDATLCDIEIDPCQNRICWQSPEDNYLWICRLDTLTWSLTVPDGRETMVDSSLVPVEASANSAEWGYDHNGTYLVYGKEINRVQYITVAFESGGTWMSSLLNDTPYRMNPHATQNPDDMSCGIHYISTLSSNFTKFKFLSNPAVERWIHNFIDAHWSRHEQIMTGVRTFNHQVAMFDPPHNLFPVQITHDAGIKYTRPYMWRAPEHQQARMFFAVADGVEVRVFKETEPFSNDYSLYMSFTSPSANPLYTKFGSPEPCVYDGQSYMTFMASTSECETSCFPGEIWIAKLDSAAPLFRMVSDTAIAIRTDPETLATTDSLLVYYTEVVETPENPTIYRLKKCDTGIGFSPLTGTGGGFDRDRRHIVAFPNPFGQYVGLKANRKADHIKLTDPYGRTIWEGTEIGAEDFSGLRSGLYFLRAITGDETQTLGVVKE